jgi:nicotinamide-nucleotide amidase
MNVYISTIGDEILIGQITDTNSAWMSRQLNQNGFKIVGKSSVADDKAAIVQGMEYGLKQADIVILTGGLGPTKDDITKKTLADYFGSAMEFHAPTHERITQYFTRIGRVLPPSMESQSTLPTKALILENKVGSAPGMWFKVENTNKIVISLPGVPFEMEHIMTEQVLPRLKEHFRITPIAHRTLLTAMEGESNIAKRIETFEDSLPSHIKLAYLPGMGEVRLRLSGYLHSSASSADFEALKLEIDQKTDEMHRLIPDLVYGKDNQTLASVVGDLLLEQNKKLGTAESCTGGYIAHQITAVQGSSAYFEGSVVAYSYLLKNALLKVSPNTLVQHGAVSKETVTEMAQGALKTLNVDVAIAVSGIAGPSGGTPDKPVGTVWLAIADVDRVETHLLRFGRDRLKNIHLTSVYTLALLRKFLM